MDHRPEDALAQAARGRRRHRPRRGPGPAGRRAGDHQGQRRPGRATPPPTACACRRTWSPQQDNPVVANLRRAGAVILGRTNTPAFSLRWFTRNALHGHTKNPRDPAITPGGSSGGAAAAVAAGIGAIGHGTDIGGSVRYPAYACGMHGLRPTLGRIPAWNASGAGTPYRRAAHGGHGPIARTIADLRLALRGDGARATPATPGGCRRRWKARRAEARRAVHAPRGHGGAARGRGRAARRRAAPGSRRLDHRGSATRRRCASRRALQAHALAGGTAPRPEQRAARGGRPGRAASSSRRWRRCARRPTCNAFMDALQKRVGLRAAVDGVLRTLPGGDHAGLGRTALPRPAGCARAPRPSAASWRRS